MSQIGVSREDYFRLEMFETVLGLDVVFVEGVGTFVQMWSYVW